MRTHTFVGLIVGLAVGLTLAALNHAFAQPQPAAKGPTWEYCSLVHSWATDAKGLQLESEEVSLVAPSWEQLCAKLNIKARKSHKAAVLDHLGSQGWELVAATNVDWSVMFTFKRSRGG